MDFQGYPRGPQTNKNNTKNTCVHHTQYTRIYYIMGVNLETLFTAWNLTGGVKKAHTYPSRARNAHMQYVQK